MDLSSLSPQMLPSDLASDRSDDEEERKVIVLVYVYFLFLVNFKTLPKNLGNPIYLTNPSASLRREIRYNNSSSLGTNS